MKSFIFVLFRRIRVFMGRLGRRVGPPGTLSEIMTEMGVFQCKERLCIVFLPRKFLLSYVQEFTNTCQYHQSNIINNSDYHSSDTARKNCNPEKIPRHMSNAMPYTPIRLTKLQHAIANKILSIPLN